jgi:hypothetical protein
MSTTPLDRQEQRRQSLRAANQVRFHGACLKRALATGDCTLSDLVGDPKIENMAVGPFLLAVHRVGSGKAQTALRAAGLTFDSPMHTVSLQIMRRIEQSLKPSPRRR